jgi:TPR repeat protein
MGSMQRRGVRFALMLGLASGSAVVAGASPGLTARVPVSAASAPLAATGAPAARNSAAVKTLAVVDATETAAGRHLLGQELRMVLDPAQPMVARQTALTAVRQAAQDGRGPAQFVIGSLYMWGPLHPAALLPKDLAKAQTYLSNAAVHGWLPAMAAMAEIELQTGHPEHASIWALVDYYFSGASHYTAVAISPT